MSPDRDFGIPRYQPDRKPVRKIRDFHPGVQVTVYPATPDGEPFEAEILYKKETKQPGNPQVVVEGRQRVETGLDSFYHVTWLKKRLSLGGGTTAEPSSAPRP